MPAVATRQDQLARVLGRTGGLRFCEHFLPWRGLVTLTYHRIGTPGDSLLDWNLWSAAAEVFDDQMRTLKRHFDVVGLADLPHVFQALGRRWARRQRFVMVTFDDGYRDNFDIAFPILKQHGIPGAFFVSTGFVDRPSLAWWDEIAWMIRSARRSQIMLPPLGGNRHLDATINITPPHHEAAIESLLRQAYELNSQQRDEFLNRLADATGSGRAPQSASQDLWMDWNMIRQMAAEGMSFGAHTVTHPVLSRLSYDEQNYEIGASRMRLEAALGQPVTAFSYPVGRRDAFNDVSKQALRANSFDWAFSYHGGFCRSSNTDRLDIPRVGIEREMDSLAIRSCTAWPHLFARQ